LLLAGCATQPVATPPPATAPAPTAPAAAPPLPPPTHRWPHARRRRRHDAGY
jgi:hypothetical protein